MIQVPTTLGRSHRRWIRSKNLAVVICTSLFANVAAGDVSSTRNSDVASGVPDGSQSFGNPRIPSPEIAIGLQNSKVTGAYVIPLFLIKGNKFVQATSFRNALQENGRLIPKLERSFRDCKLLEDGGRLQCPPDKGPAPFANAKTITRWYCDVTPGNVIAVNWNDNSERVTEPPPDLYAQYLLDWLYGAIHYCDARPVLKQNMNMQFGRLLTSNQEFVSQPKPRAVESDVLDVALLKQLKDAWKLVYVEGLSNFHGLRVPVEASRVAAIERVLAKIQLSNLGIIEIAEPGKRKRYLVDVLLQDPKPLDLESLELVAWVIETEKGFIVGRPSAYSSGGTMRGTNAYIVIGSREFFIHEESVADYAYYVAIDELVNNKFVRRANVGDRDTSATTVGK